MYCLPKLLGYIISLSRVDLAPYYLFKEKLIIKVMRQVGDVLIKKAAAGR